MKSEMSISSSKGITPTGQRKEPIPFEEIIDPQINKPGRYIGKEFGVKAKNWEQAKTLWALIYPELYEVGASNLGHIILYSILNELPEQLCDRAYLPAEDLAKKLRDYSIPLFGIESQKPLSSFDILGISLSYELGATNILEILDLAQIPIYAKDRGNHPINQQNSFPLIFAGGPTATSNPEPFAPFFDFFALGDGEELLPEIGLVITESKKLNLTRSELLFDLSNIPGVYVPSLYYFNKKEGSVKPIKTSIKEKILRRVSTPIPFYGMGLVPNIETVHDRLTIEIRRGCTRGCRFCQPGMLTRPARDVEPKEVINAIHQGITKTGYSDFSLLSLSCSDYLSLPAVGVELRNRLSDKNITLQLPSQRIDRFDENIADILGGARKAGLTFAPEAGSQRLRDIINKGLTDVDLLNGIRKAMENGYKKVKLYFMIGLPGETNEDVLGIAYTCKMLQEKCKDLGRLHLNITISNFTPKPHTPFQWHSVSTDEFKRKQKILKEAFRYLKNIKANFTDVRLSAIENFIGRGDRRLAEVIENAWRAGAGMDAWFESLDRTYLAWTKAINAAGLENYYRKIEMGSWSCTEAFTRNDLIEFCSQPLPWDHIDTGINKKWLAQDLLKALKEKVTPDCSFHECSACGVCGDELGHNVALEAPPIPERSNRKIINSEKICRIRVQFEKTGLMKFLSHLDLVRLLERALRRSNLPISYTGGFHPLPRVQIALALPLGIEAYGEWMDIHFSELIQPSQLIDILQKKLPEGFKLLNASIIPLDTCSLSQSLDSAHWSFKLSTKSLPEPTLKQWLEAIENLRNSKELIWLDQDKKGRPRKRDFRSSLKSIDLKTKIVGEKLLSSRPASSIGIELVSLINTMGLSLKPIQIQYWLEKHFDQPLTISELKRDELKLLQC